MPDWIKPATLPWYRSCPHGCADPETCPYGRNHLQKIRALLQELGEKREKVDELRQELEEWGKVLDFTPGERRRG